MLEKIRHGGLEVIDGCARRRFGNPLSPLQAVLAVHNERFYSRVVFGGEDGAGDAYMDGDWSSPDTVAVIRVAVRNLAELESGNAAFKFFAGLANRLRHLRRANTLTGSKRNIAEHYDLSNDFFELFLDDRMVYSSAIFDRANATLEDAQIEKIDRLCRKLQLRPGDRLLEIGTGWGACAVHAARYYGCEVTTTTISARQFEGAAERFRMQEPPVRDRIRPIAEDYRNLTGTFDKIVSIEMFEAVGLEHYDDFFGACDGLLTPDGVMAIQTITMNEHKFEAYKRGSDWIQRRIFPGSLLASVREIQASLVRATKMSLFHLEDIGMHYAPTLAEWRRRFFEREGDVRALGFSDRFVRMWDYYLCYCEGAFRERHIGNVQIVLTKNGNQQPLFGEPLFPECEAMAEHPAEVPGPVLTVTER
ncbi:MAG: class I SAM-dependent methyltransferase [Acidobacteriota bacterium]|nr:class I SAM-dependent methyltransferase [Acidobacteriota bacterium]